MGKVQRKILKSNTVGQSITELGLNYEDTHPQESPNPRGGQLI